MRRFPQLPLAALLLAGLAQGPAQAQSYASSVVKIHVSVQRPNFGLPWQDAPLGQGSGSGFVIREGRRLWILTNAHVVSDARFLELQREGDPRRWQARVAFVGHDCDLAVLDVEDTAFWPSVKPLPLGSDLPALDDQVVAVGYPMGGNRLSITRGVVSRLDYNVYAHSDVDSHLVLQVDAAINPGNSGGPVLYKGRVVGVAFQGIRNAQNIGYAIPIPVIRHFLDDIADGAYDGYPDLGVTHLPLRNPALRGAIGFPAGRAGVLVARVDPHGSAAGHLQAGDALMAIDGMPIADDGSITIDGRPIEFIELFERKQVGETVRFEVWRDRAARPVAFPLQPTSPAFVFPRQYDARPHYRIVGGLVFAPLSREFLMSVGRQLNRPEAQHLMYAWMFGRADHLHAGERERVILTRRLPHPVNAYADPFLHAAVAELNGQPVRSLDDLHTALGSPVDGFHVFRFHDRPDTLVLDAEAAETSWAAISAVYQIPQPAVTGNPAP